MRPVAVLLLFVCLASPLFAGKKPKKELARTGALYNLKTGERVVFTYSAKTLTGTFANGEVLTGDYATVVEGSNSWGSIYRRGVTNNNNGERTDSYSRTESREAHRENAARGTAIATGDKGTILECEYITTETAGSGYCEDNRGIRYKIMF